MSMQGAEQNYDPNQKYHESKEKRSFIEDDHLETFVGYWKGTIQSLKQKWVRSWKRSIWSQESFWCRPNILHRPSRNPYCGGFVETVGTESMTPNTSSSWRNPSRNGWEKVPTMRLVAIPKKEQQWWSACSNDGRKYLYSFPSLPFSTVDQNSGAAPPWVNNKT